MVYKVSDIKHLEVMASLQNAEKNEYEPILENKADNTFSGKILLLCNKLRSHGFDKYADALEKRFIIYKSAANVHLYRAHDEDGDDLINAAHPEGDVNMGEASDKNGDVETILSKHKKIVDVIEKQPTGKLAKYVDLCKSILKVADNQPLSYDDLKKKVDFNVEKVLQIIEYVGTLAKPEMTVSSDFDMIANRIKKAATNRILDNLNEMSSQIDAIKGRLSKHWFTLGMSGITEDTWIKVEKLLNKAMAYTSDAIGFRKEMDAIAAEQAASRFDEKQEEPVVPSPPQAPAAPPPQEQAKPQPVAPAPAAPATAPSAKPLSYFDKYKVK